MMVGHGDLTGSDRVHISVSYRDGPLDTSENMYFHEMFPLDTRFRGVFAQLHLLRVQSLTSTACEKVSYRLAGRLVGVCLSLIVR